MEVILIIALIIAVFICFEMFNKFELLFAIFVAGFTMSMVTTIVLGILPLTTTEINLGMPSFIEDQVIVKNPKPFIVVKEVTKRDYFIQRNIKYLFYENKPEVTSATFIIEFSK